MISLYDLLSLSSNGPSRTKASTTKGFMVQRLVDQLKAVAEPTRLRIVGLCAAGELAVSELTQILEQSQPRVSRHLRVLTDAGLIAPMREGNWTFYRLERGQRVVSSAVLDLIDVEDPTIAADLRKLADVRLRRRESAERYFNAHANDWDEIRALYVDSGEVETKLLVQAPEGVFDVHLDIGTGTGRVLSLLAPRVRQSIGIDISRAMLSIARDQVARSGGTDISLRLGDMYALSMPDSSVDLVTIHLVLHYSDAPEQVIAEAARVLRPGGRLIIMDFAPHTIEELRSRHAHRRLGFPESEVREWFNGTKLNWRRAEALPGESLTVMVWTADKQSAAMTDNTMRVAASPWI
jgi:ubiquinone/menaquinone biosynthesis C-methylase UbiE